jgi:hypothetical protein
MAQAVLQKNTFGGWLVDSEFSGVTVLHAPENADIEYVSSNSPGGAFTDVLFLPVYARSTA